MVRKFENCTATIYSLATTKVRGSWVQAKTAVYSDIRGGLWRARRSYGPTALAVQTNQNAYTLCLAGQYTGILVGYIVAIEGVEYKVDDIVAHPNSKDEIDNFELTISKSTNGN